MGCGGERGYKKERLVMLKKALWRSMMLKTEISGDDAAKKSGRPRLTGMKILQSRQSGERKKMA